MSGSRDDATPRTDDRRSSLRLASAVSTSVATYSGDPRRAAASLRALADAISTLGVAPTVVIKPFEPGRRSNVEEYYPGLGSSDCVALVTGDRSEPNRCAILFDVPAQHDRLSLDASIHWADDEAATPIAGWDRRPVEFDDRSGLYESLIIQPEIDLAGEDLGFAHGYLRRAVVDLRLSWDDVVISGASIDLDVCDIGNLGSLYGRVLDHVVGADTARQAEAWGGGQRPESIHHPWSPVLIIGTEKAALYTRALVADIVGKFDHLSNPAWLLRVGVYLELLTCLGIFEAVRDDLGDLLSAEERECFEHSPAWAEIRERIDPEAWRTDVWSLRTISRGRLGIPRAGAVSTLNLIQKKRATLAFLHVHHEDLKHAIQLAGPNLADSQETWQRVFRDAERAVLRKTVEVFPELEYLPGPMREVSMWQQQGVAGQQGLYPTACTQYLASMNYVAEWAMSEGLMQYTGDECISRRVSLLDAIMNDVDRVPILERADGYSDTADLRVPVARSAVDSESGRLLADFEELLAGVSIFALMSTEERRTLAEGALPVLAVPGERIVVQGAAGDSLYVVAEGDVEVLVNLDGRDRAVDTMGRGSVIGEMALLSGERRSATVRAIDTALILEIGPAHYEPVLRVHPEWLDELASIMDDRLRERRSRLARKEWIVNRPARRRATRAIRAQISERFFADGRQ